VIIIRPYRVIDASHIQLGTWTDQSDNPVGESVRFQVGIDLSLKCQVEVDVPWLIEELFNSEVPDPSDLGIEWIVEWYSNKTKLAGVAFRAPVLRKRQDLAIMIPGDLIGGRIELSRRIVLSRDIDCAFPLAPKKNGSIIWSETTSLLVEGVGAQMPISFVSFEDNGLKKSAIWAVDRSKLESLTEDSFDEPFPEHLRVLLNVTNPQAQELVVADSPDHPVLGFPLKTLARDSLTAMIELAQSEFFDLGARYEDGSLGQQISTALKIVGIRDVQEFVSKPLVAQNALIQGAIFR
jgi:hypothetical protein